MIRRFKSMTRQEKLMLLSIILLVIAIITRWGYIKTEMSKSWGNRFSIEKADSVDVDKPRLNK